MSSPMQPENKRGGGVLILMGVFAIVGVIAFLNLHPIGIEWVLTVRGRIYPPAADCEPACGPHERCIGGFKHMPECGRLCLWDLSCPVREICHHGQFPL